jgi:hypothetical protein
MEYLLEVTDWGDHKVPNHTYIVNGAGHLAGYIKNGTTEEIMFKSPMKQWSKSRRKFKKVLDKSC